MPRTVLLAENHITLHVEMSVAKLWTHHWVTGHKYMSQEMGPGDMKIRGELYPLSVGNLGLNVNIPGYIKYLCIDSCPIANKEDKTRF